MITAGWQGKLSPLNHHDTQAENQFRGLLQQNTRRDTLIASEQRCNSPLERKVTYLALLFFRMVCLYVQSPCSRAICNYSRHSTHKDRSKLSLWWCSGFFNFFKFFLRFCERARAVNLLLFYSQMKSQSFPNPVSWQ